MAASHQSYALSFNPSNGFFQITGINGTPTPDLFRFIVTEPNSSIQITCLDGLSFDGPVSWHPTNTLNGNETPIDPKSTELVFPTPPEPHDRIGFTLKTHFDSGSKRILLQPELFVTASTLAPPPFHSDFFELAYRPADGSFCLQHSMEDPTMDAEVVTRLGMGSFNQGGEFPVRLITIDAAQGEAAKFVPPGVIFTNAGKVNGGEVHRFANDLLELNIPFNSNAGVGMNFVIEYAGVKIHSPDPIIVDKTIGTNPGPGF